MPTSWLTSPVTEALAKVLEILHPGRIARKRPEEGKVYLVTSYREDFNFLWTFWKDEALQDIEEREDNPSNLESKGRGFASDNDLRDPVDGDIIQWIYSQSGNDTESKTLVLVADGMPEPGAVGNVHVASYVTAYDWVVALSLVLNDRENAIDASRKAGVRVMILDLTSTEATSSESARLFYQLHYGPRPLFDWVRLYRPAANFAAEGTVEDLFRDLCDSALYRSTTLTKNQRGAGMDLGWDALRRIWAARLLAPADPRDRHAIANLVGPQILLTAMSSSHPSLSDTSPCLFALIALMRAIRLSPNGQRQVSSPWLTPAQRSVPDLRHTDQIFVLLDDLHDMGWSQFLRLALGLEKKDNNLLVFDKPDRRAFGPQGNQTLLDLLKDGSRLRVKEGLELCPGAKDAILFLDLRLFNTRTSKEEMGFFGDLLNLAKQVEDNNANREDLPWRGFTSTELQAVANCIEQEKVEHDDYFIALTMLPRLIALVDPSLPIVLFSSTGQRRIVEALKDYGSIVTEFDKPRFSGDTSSNIVAMARIRFEQALSYAFCLVRGRAVCQRFQSAPVANRNETSEPYVEIYIDEANEASEETFRVGGIAIIYEGHDKADEFNKEIVKQSLVWGPTNIEPRPTNVMPKRLGDWRDYQPTVFKPIDNLLQSGWALDAIGFGLVIPPIVKWLDARDLTSPWCLDNFYRTLVLYALEVLLFEVLPESIGQQRRPFECGVYVATRRRYESDVDAPRDWPKLTSRYGIQIIKDKDRNKEYFVSVASNSVYPMVAQVLALNPTASVRIVAARGGKLSYGVTQRTHYERELARPAHFLADPVVRFCQDKNKLIKLPSLGEWLNRGFVSIADDRFVSSLLACRHARADRHVEAILEAYNASQCTPGNAELDRWVKTRIAQSARVLSGPDFSDLCRRLLSKSNTSLRSAVGK